MPVIFQLSDLHIFSQPAEQDLIFSALVQAMESEASRRGGVDLLVFTGDIFDSATVPISPAVDRFLNLYRQIAGAIGASVPTVVVPGNHDRRRLGLFGPHREQLFESLRHSCPPEIYVHGSHTPFLAKVLSPEFHGLPICVVAYDSTHLTRGLVSAGGMIRQHDLLYAASQLRSHDPDWPVLLLLHHHLVPTPLTDLGTIDAARAAPPVRWAIRHLLPKLVSFADREELTMTALGAGTALSTLHSLERAILVLHGHKHYATARLLDATRRGQGDIMMVSAGSAGVAQSWKASSSEEARLWPSFNVVGWQDGQFEVSTVSFGWKDESLGHVAHRPMAVAQRRGAQWHQTTVAPSDDGEGPHLRSNRCHYHLEPSGVGNNHWDYSCVRHIDTNSGPSGLDKSYLEVVDGPAHATVELRNRVHELPFTLCLNPGETVEYLVRAGVPRTLTGAGAEDGQNSPFASLLLTNRYRCDVTRLEVTGLGNAAKQAFATITDLGTGLESPLPVEHLDGNSGVSAEVEQCQARAMVRIYWPLGR